MLYLLLSVIFLCSTLLAVDPELNVKKMSIVVREIIEKKKTKDSYAKALKHLECLSNEDFKTTYIGLPMRAKLSYLMRLNIGAYEQFLRRFKDEEDWRKFWQQLSDSERCHIPNSWTQQMGMIRDCYYRFYRNGFFVSFLCQNKADVMADIAYYKKYYHEYEGVHTWSDPHYKELSMDAAFQRKKLKMLLIP